MYVHIIYSHTLREVDRNTNIVILSLPRRGKAPLPLSTDLHALMTPSRDDSISPHEIKQDKNRSM